MRKVLVSTVVVMSLAVSGLGSNLKDLLVVDRNIKQATNSLNNLQNGRVENVEKGELYLEKRISTLKIKAKNLASKEDLKRKIALVKTYESEYINFKSDEKKVLVSQEKIIPIRKEIALIVKYKDI